MNKLKVEDIAAMIKANDFLKKEEIGRAHV